MNETEKLESPGAERFTVMVDDNFHFMDEGERSTYGVYESYEAAVASAKSMVDESLRKSRSEENPHDPDVLYKNYMDYGDDPFIMPEPEGRHFSAWKYAECRAKEICREPWPSEQKKRPDVPAGMNEVTVFDSDTTLRWTGHAGDFIWWFRLSNWLWGDPRDLDVMDFWALQEGDQLQFSASLGNLPEWFHIHPSEVSGAAVYDMLARLDNGYEPEEVVEAPNLWRVRAGDRMVWVGGVREGAPPHGGVLATVDFAASALVVGLTGDGIPDPFRFGGMRGNQDKRAQQLGRIAVEAARQMPFPMNIADEWKIGAV